MYKKALYVACRDSRLVSQSFEFSNLESSLQFVNKKESIKTSFLLQPDRRAPRIGSNLEVMSARTWLKL